MSAATTASRSTVEAPSPAETSSGVERARTLAASVVDPELPMLTLVDLGVLRSVELAQDGTAVASITPTYSGCPALATMREDLLRVLGAAGFTARVRVVLEPAWSSDWITERGRRLLREHGLSAPGPAPTREGPVPLTLAPTRRDLICPQCASSEVELTSEFGPTACKALYRCLSCREPFEHVKEI